MIDAIESAQSFVAGRTRSDLDADLMLLFALVRAVEIVGEAASRVSPEGRAFIPAIPWTAMSGMRNRLVLAYFDVDADLLWRTVTEAMPALLPHLQLALEPQE